MAQVSKGTRSRMSAAQQIDTFARSSELQSVPRSLSDCSALSWAKVSSLFIISLNAWRTFSSLSASKRHCSHRMASARQRAILNFIHYIIRVQTNPQVTRRPRALRSLMGQRFLLVDHLPQRLEDVLLFIRFQAPLQPPHGGRKAESFPKLPSLHDPWL